MAEKLLRKGQRVYAADGTFLGRLLQCDARFMVIGRSRWKPDHWIIGNEEVAAFAADVVILRSVPSALRPETSERWWPTPDPLGNADGIDLEPLRAGMAELDDKDAGTSPPWRAPAEDAAARATPVPSADDARRLDRERRVRLDARTERLITAEVEDLELGAPSEVPPGLESAHDAAFDVEPVDPVPARRERGAVRKIIAAPRVEAPAKPRPPELTPVGEDACRTPRTLERVLRGAGLSVAEAHAIAEDGFRGLAALHGRG